ncbi:hypothetical protein NDU88_005344 [Pleurodeles waltl]|uniref:Uncharacterized protein n=1 Tax=Pleurodeles waltl TaxID=8319 RepID=A0AAV7TV64_PLEWA|nr:hypothetical protein NDU88_005344 [Pleurodeles waltl]
MICFVSQCTAPDTYIQDGASCRNQDCLLPNSGEDLAPAPGRVKWEAASQETMRDPGRTNRSEALDLSAQKPSDIRDKWTHCEKRTWSGLSHIFEVLHSGKQGRSSRSFNTIRRGTGEAVDVQKLMSSCLACFSGLPSVLPHSLM